jgi:hypothetical protein
VPIAPERRELLQCNSTNTLVRLNAFRAALCAINGFELRYRQQSSDEWIEISKLAGGRTLAQFELVDLRSATWYDLQVTALSEAGSTQVEYSFATLTEQGSTIAPLSVLSSAQHPADEQRIRRYLQMLLPLTSGLIAVLLGALACVALRRVASRQALLPPAPTHQMLNGHHQMVCTPDQRSYGQHTGQSMAAIAAATAAGSLSMPSGLSSNAAFAANLNGSIDPNTMTLGPNGGRTAKNDPILNSLLYGSQSACGKQLLYETANAAQSAAAANCYNPYSAGAPMNEQQANAQQFASFYCPSPYASTRLSYFFQDNPLTRISIAGAGGQLATYTKSTKCSAQENSYDMPLLKVSRDCLRQTFDRFR